MTWGELKVRLGGTQRNYLGYRISFDASFQTAFLSQELNASAALYNALHETARFQVPMGLLQGRHHHPGERCALAARRQGEPAEEMNAATASDIDVGSILVANGLMRSFSGFTAVKNVEIDVRRNTIHSVIGPNGAGKSTLFNLLTRQARPASVM